jgi:hypothetical protein
MGERFLRHGIDPADHRVEARIHFIDRGAGRVSKLGGAHLASRDQIREYDTIEGGILGGLHRAPFFLAAATMSAASASSFFSSYTMPSLIVYFTPPMRTGVSSRHRR